MRPIAVLLLVLAAASCKKELPPENPYFHVRGNTAGGTPMMDFDSPEGRFSCQAPSNWEMRPEKDLDPRKGVAFTKHDAAITILRYPESEAGTVDAQKHAETFWQTDPNGKQPEIKRETVGGTTVLRFHQERAGLIPHSKTPGPTNRYEYALIPVPGGFVEITYRAPLDTFELTLPVFKEVVRTFKPKS
jgi:hypothetical protein